MKETQPEWRQGWPTLLGAVLGMGAGIGLFGGVFGLFVKPLAAAFGWSRGMLGLQAIAVLGTALAMPVIGRLVDRRGSGWLILGGAVLFAGAYVALAGMSGALWQYIAIIAFIGLAAGPATAPLVVTRPLVNAFVRARGLALAIGMSGAVLLAAGVLPILQHVIAGSGWRMGFLMMAPLTLALGLVSFLLLRSSDARTEVAAVTPSAAAALGHSFPEAVRDPRFWLLALSMVALSLVEGAVSTQFQPLLSDLGVPGPTAALLGSWYAGSVVFGRLSVGGLLDRLWAPGVGALSLLGPLVGLLLILSPQPDLPRLIAGASFIGVSAGAQGDMLAFFTARFFGLRAFGAVFGLQGLFFGLAIAAGAASGGFIYDLAHSYAPLLNIGAGLAIVSSLSLLAAGLLKGSPAVPAPRAGESPLPIRSAL